MATTVFEKPTSTEIGDLSWHIANYGLDSGLGNNVNSPDFNNIKACGRYYGSGALTNAPINGTGSHPYVLYVYPAGSRTRVIQELVIFDQTDNPQKYMRMQTGDTTFCEWACLSRSLQAYSIATNLDNCKYAGTYLISNGTSNAPFTYGLCITFSTVTPNSTGNGWVMQLAYQASASEYKLYMRKSINNAAFTTWTSVTFS